jgi:hypothetical protein
MMAPCYPPTHDPDADPAMTESPANLVPFDCISAHLKATGNKPASSLRISLATPAKRQLAITYQPRGISSHRSSSACPARGLAPRKSRKPGFGINKGLETAGLDHPDISGLALPVEVYSQASAFD